MNYITLNRVITFCVGIGFIYLANVIFENASKYVYENVFYGLSILSLILGLYIIIASLVPYKKMTKEVSEIVYEGLFHILIEVVFRGIIRVIMAIFHGVVHFFSHW